MDLVRFFGEVKKEEQSRTFKLPHFSQVAPQSRLKVHKKRSKPPAEQGPAPPFFPRPRFPPLSPLYRSSLKEVY